MAVTQLLEPLMDTLEGIRMPTRFIHLDRMPRDEEGVAELHQALQKCQDGPLGGGVGVISLSVGGLVAALSRPPKAPCLPSLYSLRSGLSSYKKGPKRTT